MTRSLWGEDAWKVATVGPPRPDEDPTLAGLVVQMVAAALGIEAREIATGGRRPRAAKARQIAMYLAHTGLDWTMRRTGDAFGRDRSTVSHACNRVEDLREDPAFDRGVATLERWVRGLAHDRVRL